MSEHSSSAMVIDTLPAGSLSAVARKRLLKELREWVTGDPVPGMSVQQPERLDLWYVKVVGAEDTIFVGEEYTLRFSFPREYPIEAPEVVFLQPTPAHQHVYTNGHICLNVLYDGWSPALTVTSVCLSILSMLSSATEKGIPKDNDAYIRNSRGRSPKLTRWLFHDDSV
ncbi:Probable ubiquitin-conjugating enzyme E2 16 [Galdieria sulphuraria]|uniref:Ubiquitin-conjugating enzyme E2 W n=1 Tax=Galdieria sulphuraria TaxID=130081 RepID=M2VXW6_GALSU|nr:ubiquitin-conjugating enzyme E2 W [Galdieria sulphuraria]EME28141.1 ubiquitin-conjugating enzyme E2 W [Galdieria sulphuraria]GJD12065.1 Probable ubiquitin-conjugating enzyme E2 16 [Galdieria sulphuraria]|eukprot:XP_005704661.1 ubiquitin-conjugating enzyme E2 W [Galdieria sulphuraria]